MPIHLSERAAARAGLVTTKKTAAKDARPALPRAGPAERTGLSTFIAAGWAWEFRVGFGYRLEKGALSSGWCASERAACDAAKALTR